MTKRKKRGGTIYISGKEPKDFGDEPVMTFCRRVGINREVHPDCLKSVPAILGVLEPRCPACFKANNKLIRRENGNA